MNPISPPRLPEEGANHQDAARTSEPRRFRDGWRGLSPAQRTRYLCALAVLAALTVAFLKPLVSLMIYASGTDLHSHIILIPLVSLYLLSLRRDTLPGGHRSSWGWGIGVLLLGLGALSLAFGWWPTAGPLTPNDTLAAYAAAYVCGVWAIGFMVLGAGWMAAAAFPLAFLIFLVPLPDGLTHTLETASQHASAEATSWLYQLTGLPHVRDGLVYQLPGITIKVAQECSGIRSTWVLFITSLVAAEMFLKSPWRRFILVALVIPLGILRNGFRILVISWLCVEVGPHMIHSVIHHRGGPIFFALSLIPLFLILWLLRRGEVRRSGRDRPRA